MTTTTATGSAALPDLRTMTVEQLLAEAAAWQAAQEITDRWPTPGHLAATLGKRTVQTPALDLIDAALVRALNTPDSRVIISMPPQEGKPVVDSAMILMGDGSRKPLAEVQVGDTVVTHRGRARLVTAVHVQGELPTVKITTHAGRVIQAERTHPFLTPAGWVNAGDLAVGDVLAAVRAPQTLARETLDRGEARLLGYFIGDGNTTASAANLNASITCVDPAEADDIEACAAGLGFAVRRQPKRLLLSGGVRPWLRRHGLAGCTSWTKRVPPELFTQPPHIIAEFLGAYFACDGTVSRRGGARPDARVEYASVSHDLLADVQHLLLRLGIATTLRPKRTTVSGKPYTSWRLLMRRQDDVARFRAAVPVVHAKAAVLAEWPLRRTEFDTAYAADEIVAVKDGGTAPCRCLTVDEDHTFTAEDVVVHNSQRASRRFPLWALLKRPETRIAIASYEHAVARRWGRAIRDDVEGNPGLGLTVRPDLSAQHEWALAGHEGGVFAAGVGGALTGRPVDLLIIDDPVKDRMQADSRAYRDRVWDWWTDVASTRLAPGAPVVLILTRWHEDDLAGRLLAAEDGHLWDVVNIPAQADHRPEDGETDPLGREPGEFMLSARGRTLGQWEAIKVRSGPKTWASLYQGRPSPVEGGLFPADGWSRYAAPLWNERVDGSRVVPLQPGDSLAQSWDMAFKKTSSSDYVVGTVWLKRGVDLYLLDMVRARLGFTETVDAVRVLSARWPQALLKLVEDKANGPAVVDTLRREVPGFRPVEPEGGKEARAHAASPLVFSGNVHLPQPALLPNVAELIEEARQFPNGAHDDAVDSLTQAVIHLVVKGLIGEARATSAVGIKVGAGSSRLARPGVGAAGLPGGLGTRRSR